jgi:hypothetical protein
MEAVSKYFVDTLRHDSPFFGDTATSKQAWLDSLSVINKTGKITFTNFDFYPAMDPGGEIEDVDVRVYANINLESNSGMKTSGKYFAVFSFTNDDNKMKDVKIYNVNEFYDATGMFKAASSANK